MASSLFLSGIRYRDLDMEVKGMEGGDFRALGTSEATYLACGSTRSAWINI